MVLLLLEGLELVGLGDGLQVARDVLLGAVPTDFADFELVVQQVLDLWVADVLRLVVLRLDLVQVELFGQLVNSFPEVPP